MSGLNRKMRRKLGERSNSYLSEEEYRIIWNEVAKQYNKEALPRIVASMTEFQKKVDRQMMVVSCNIIMENYGKLKNKETRIKNFIDLYNEQMQEWNKLSGEEQYKKIDEEVERLGKIAGEKLTWIWERTDAEREGVNEY